MSPFADAVIDVLDDLIAEAEAELGRDLSEDERLVMAGELLSALEPTGNKKKAKMPSASLKMSPDKACKILKDGTVHGKPLTKKQRGMFGALCGKRGKKPVTGNSEVSAVADPFLWGHAVTVTANSSGGDYSADDVLETYRSWGGRLKETE